ncbi:ABC transporter permease [Segeticoccus rhizosphaerae]|uniref:ABC transporter permease n=1 Tax=Segeticoccus rhizosphaerae TaxID=1104777 RepID=UPI0010C12359|nr:ABC transporter permease [Ornithinicoccus soli]
MAGTIHVAPRRLVGDIRLQDQRGLYRIGFLLTGLLIWWIGATFIAPTVIPSVEETLSRVGDLVTGGELYGQLWATTQRVLAGFACAYVAGLTLGVAMGRSKRVEAFFEMFIVIGTSQPGLFVAMILLVALGLSTGTAIFTLAYLATPIITISIWQGAKNLDTGLNEVADVFGYSRASRVRHVILPQLIGPGLAGLRQGLGITWKYVVMIEMIGLNDGVGYQVTRAFQLFNLTDVVAWTLCFLAFVLLLEYGVIRSAERRLFRWRDKPTGRVRSVSDPTQAKEPNHV